MVLIKITKDISMSFKNYLKKERGPSVIYTMGRFNPFHIEHSQLFKDMNEYAKKNKIQDEIVYTSFVQNSKKNPLFPQDKIMYIKKILPQGMKISEDTSIKNAFQALEDLIKKGYTKIIFMVGEDRVKDFQSLARYAKQWATENDTYVDFKIEQRKGSRTSNVSGTEMRNLAKEGNFNEFKKMLPKKLQKDAEEIFQKTRIGLGID